MDDERALAAMVESIRKHGYLAHWPILMWRGEILDGRLRAKACEILGVIPTVEAFDGSEAEAAAAWQERNTTRRTVSDGVGAGLAIGSGVAWCFRRFFRWCW